MAAGSAVNNLNKALVGDTIVTLPRKIEQRKIGNLFSQIDNLITLHQRKDIYLSGKNHSELTKV